jgi:hypothetical protein
MALPCLLRLGIAAARTNDRFAYKIHGAIERQLWAVSDLELGAQVAR